MKVTVDESKKNTRKPFPKLMITEDGCVVMFLEAGDGVLIKQAPGMITKEWERHDTWSVDLFENFHGTITLEND